MQLCDEEDFYNNTVRSAEQALLTIHGNSFLDSENEDLGGIGDNLLTWSGAGHGDAESDGESVTTDVGCEECPEDDDEVEDEDEDEDDEEDEEEEERGVGCRRVGAVEAALADDDEEAAADFDED